MPVVTIQALPDSSVKIDAILGGVVKSLAAAIETTTDNVWANFTPMVAVSEGETAERKRAYHIIVTVLASPRPEEHVQLGLAAIAKVVADGFGVPPARVWAHWVVLDPKRVFAGG